MSSIDSLRHRLWNLDGRGYPAYKSIKGRHHGSGLTLIVDHVQGDPFAAPSKLRYRLSSVLSPGRRGDARRAVEDFALRALVERFRSHRRGAGSGKSGAVLLPSPGQQVLERTAVLLSKEGDVEVRVGVGLPAAGRRILGERAAELLCDAVPQILQETFASLEGDPLERHIATVEDAVAIRGQLDEHGLVAFVADGALLPRRSGTDDRPMQDEVIPFQSPKELSVTLRAPHAGTVTGMGVPRGLTLIVGGGYHGKSTLLAAIERGVYDHIPEDGRERVVTRADAMKIRAEDGRSVSAVDISPFIGILPGGRRTESFSTDDASGSTSQAAALSESLELGARLLLIDEDTSATNFLIRDSRMAELVAREDEPITPLRDRVDWLREHGCSLLMVVGGSGDYFEVADTVLALRDYHPWVATERAQCIARAASAPRPDTPFPERWIRPRRIELDSVDPRRGKKERATRVRDLDRVSFGEGELDLGALEQLVEPGQTRFIAELLASRPSELEGVSLEDGLRALAQRIANDGLHGLQERPDGEWAAARPLEIGAALNRLRGARFTTDGVGASR